MICAHPEDWLLFMKKRIKENQYFQLVQMFLLILAAKLKNLPISLLIKCIFEDSVNHLTLIILTVYHPYLVPFSSVVSSRF